MKNSKARSYWHSRNIVWCFVCVGLLMNVVVALVSAPIAQAKTGAVTANGGITCNDSVGKITFKPPLRSSGTASSEEVTFHVNGSDCTTYDNTNLPVGKITAKISGSSTSTSNSCSTLGLGSTATATATYKTDAKVEPTNVTSGVTFSAQGQMVNVSMPKPHMLTGSFPEPTAYSTYVDWTLGASVSEIAAACSSKGLSKTTVVSGTMDL